MEGEEKGGALGAESGSSLCSIGKECIAECGKAASRRGGECVVVLVNCPLDPDDPYLIALHCSHYLRNDIYIAVTSITNTLLPLLTIAGIYHFPLPHSLTFIHSFIHSFALSLSLSLSQSLLLTPSIDQSVELSHRNFISANADLLECLHLWNATY
ncbi:hypothetical protein LOAG_10806 [Loa loa]|uniref:Uncharacterized protein n=1 Tax=Loa loa TaxID=7209 RepID=A0A1S0TP24_LOALO|nr:hypothetical protein LOAG_10806 [Loa loa]EFO17691.1 hypothetical protein LOAG_10806 [Loa loa]